MEFAKVFLVVLSATCIPSIHGFTVVQQTQHHVSPNSFLTLHNNVDKVNLLQLSMVKSFVSQQSERYGTYLEASKATKEKKSSSKKKSMNMTQKRKKRGQKFIPKPMARPDILDSTPNPDEWSTTQSTEEQIQSMKDAEAAAAAAAAAAVGGGGGGGGKDSYEEEVQSQASALIETQRKSVQVLTYVKEQVLDLPIDKIVESLQSPSGCDKVFDEFLGRELSSEMLDEALKMFENNKMELDLKAGLCSGEYSVVVKGGEEQYADCPRVTEFVVSLTRHLTGVLNERRGNDDDNSLEFALDETASMAELRTFQRSARKSSIALLMGKDTDSLTNDELRSNDEKPFQYVVPPGMNDNETMDYRKVTVLYFLLPGGWNKECGGGITIKNNNDEIFVEAKNDRLLVLSSDSCLHRMEEWIGDANGMEGGGVVVTHFVQKQE